MKTAPVDMVYDFEHNSHYSARVIVALYLHAFLASPISPDTLTASFHVVWLTFENDIKKTRIMHFCV